MTEKIKIISCTKHRKKHYDYSELIGKEFNVKSEGSKYYILEGVKGVILKSDCQAIALLTGKQLTEGESINTNYKLIPMSKITNEAREIAVRWGDNMKDDFISQKHKLASDIMNYSTQQTAHLQQQLKEAKGLLEKTDDLLTRLEDYTHGKDGESITELRASINKFLTRNQ